MAQHRTESSALVKRSPMTAISLRGIRSHAGRMLLTGLAITVSVGFVAGTLIMTDGLNSLVEGAVGRAYQNVDAEVGLDEENADAASTITTRLVSEIESLPDVDRVDPVYAMDPDSMIAIDDDGERVVGPSGSIGSFSWSGPEGYGEYDLIDGRPPGPGSVAVTSAYAEELGVAVGDTVTLRSANDLTDEPYQVAAIVESAFDPDSFELLFDVDTAMALEGADGPQSVAVVASPGIDQEAVVTAIEPLLDDPELRVETKDILVEEQTAAVRSGLQIFEWILLGFAFVALFVSVFIISNTFAILIAERVREIGVLRAIGASRRQVRRLVLVEAVALGAVASALGIVVGIFVARGIASLLGQGQLPGFETVITMRTTVVAISAGVVVTLVAAWLPARRAGRLSPVAAIRNDVSTDGNPRRRIIIGSVVTVVSLGALLSLLADGDDVDGTLVALRLGLGTVGVFVALSMLTVAIVPGLVAMFNRPISTLRGQVGELAVQNAARNPLRTAATATTLMIGIALVTVAVVFGSSLSEGITGEADRVVKGDLYIQSEGAGFVSEELARQAGAVNGVDGGTLLLFASVAIGDPDDEQFISLTAVDGSTGATIFDPNVTEGEGPAELASGSALLARSLAEDEGIAIGDTIDLQFPDDVTDSLTVIGLYEGTDNLMGSVVVDQEQYRSHPALPTTSGVFGVAVADGADVAVVRSDLEALAEPHGLVVVDLQGVKDFFTGQVGELLLIVNGLLAVSLVVAFFGIINAVMLSVLQRTREIGLLRAVGMTRRQLRSTIRWEATLITVMGTTAGVLVGLSLGWLIVEVIDTDLVPFTISVLSLIVMVALGASLGLLAALLPARRAARLDVLDAIATT